MQKSLWKNQYHFQCNKATAVSKNSRGLNQERRRRLRKRQLKSEVGRAGSKFFALIAFRSIRHMLAIFSRV